MPARVRIAAWHRGARPTPSRWPLHVWEPVIYRGGRQRDTGARRADSIVYGAGPLDTLPGRVIGAKPAAVCRWIFQFLGAGPRTTARGHDATAARRHPAGTAGQVRS